MESLSDLYPELFHYTTIEAFESICRTQQFWATHYEDLNDATELRQVRAVIIDLIEPIIREYYERRMKTDAKFRTRVQRSGGIQRVAQKEAGMWADSLHRPTFGEGGHDGPFVVSFCAHDRSSYESQHGLLSQWRGYGAGGGVAIVLDTARMLKKMRHEADEFEHEIFHVGDVKYDDAPQVIKENVNIKPLFDSLPNVLNEFYSTLCPSSTPPPIMGDVRQPYIFASTLIKHRAFREESELRIVVSPRPLDSTSVSCDDKLNCKPTKAIRYRLKGNGEARYIELFGATNGASLPIKRVIVGPSRTRNLNLQRIREILAGSDIEVCESKTPFLP